MKVRRTGGDPAKVEQQMTAMIDVVFQLLTFFVMSFKVASLEGDFSIKMPLGQAAKKVDNEEPEVPPLKLRMQSDGQGQLVGMALNNTALPTGNWEALRQRILELVGGGGGPGSARESAEVEIDCDYNLKYINVIEAITAVSGYPAGDGQVVKLVEKIKFSPPRPNNN